MDKKIDMNIDLNLRYSLNKNLLKSVLVRVDYTGVTGVDRWVDENKDFMYSAFNEYNRGVNNNARLDLTNMEEVAKTLSIPVSELKKETQHIYTSCKLYHNNNPEDIVTDNVKMTLTSYYMTFYVVCSNYRNIDVYLNFLTLFFEKFAKISEYIKIRRIGIRKIGGKPFDSIEQAHSVYKPKLFFGYNIVDGFHVFQKEYKDYYILPDESLKVNYTRMFREQNTPAGNKYAFILDIDGYVDEYIINLHKYNLPDNIGKIMNDINNHLFVIFHNSVQPNYIDNHGEEQ